MEIFIIDCAGDSHPVAVNNGEIAATLPLTLKKKNFGLVPSSNNTAYLARKMTTHYLTKIARFYVFFWGSISLVAQLRIVAEGAAVRNRTAGRLDKNAYFPGDAGRVSIRGDTFSRGRRVLSRARRGDPLRDQANTYGADHDTIQSVRCIPLRDLTVYFGW
jgi:hypothetical protein